jgi:hypothetical protein
MRWDSACAGSIRDAPPAGQLVTWAAMDPDMTVLFAGSEDWLLKLIFVADNK